MTGRERDTELHANGEHGVDVTGIAGMAGEPVPISEIPTQERLLRVLLVEDSSTAARLVTELLGKGLHSHVTQRAETAEAALNYLQLEHPDVVLLDLNLPDSVGLSTFHRIHVRCPDTPIIILSGDNDIDLAVEAVHCGAQDYLVKSRFDHEHLSRSVRFSIERTERLRMEREVAAARIIQEQLLPSTGPDAPGFDIAGLSFPALQVSGDYFDFIPMAGGRLGIIVGDACGHGLGPSLRMAETRAYIRALACTSDADDAESGDPDLSQILNRANLLLMTAPSWYFVTLIFLCLEPTTGAYTYASAGHRGFHLSRDGSDRVLGSTGPALGLLKTAHFGLSESQFIEPGDRLFLGTDGFEEARARTGQLYGVDRLLNSIRCDGQAAAESVIRHVSSESRAFCGGTPQSDDMTAVLIQRKIRPAEFASDRP